MLMTEIELFYHVAKLKNLSKAAAQLNLSKSYISKRLVALEKNMGSRLLIRNTRKVELTEAGSLFFQTCEKALIEVEKGYYAISELTNKPKGLLKVSAPPAFANYILAKILPSFMRKYPEIIVNIQLESKLVDLIQEKYDVILRSAVLVDSTFIAKKLFAMNSVLCATSNYLKRYGTPSKPEDLSKHICCGYGQINNELILKFTKDRQTKTITITNKLLSNYLEFNKKMVLSGACLGIFPEFMITTELQKKKMVVCLADYTIPTTYLYALYPEKNLMPLKTKIFLQELTDFLQ